MGVTAAALFSPTEAARSVRGASPALAAPLMTCRSVQAAQPSSPCAVAVMLSAQGIFILQLSFSVMVFISCLSELETFMEYHMVFVYTGSQLQC